MTLSVYHDHSDKDDQTVLQLIMRNAELSSKLGDAANRELFPVKLHMMVEATSVSNQADIIRWLPHGRAFKFFDRDRLVSDLLPHYLQRQKKFSSFQRQLNMYGFLKLTGDHDDNGAYYHEFFLRGRSALSRLIFRLEKSDSGVRRKFDVETEPNFSQMLPLPAALTIRDSTTVPLLPPRPAAAHPQMLDLRPRQPPLPQQHPQLSRESVKLSSVAKVQDFGDIAYRSGMTIPQGAIDLSGSEKSNQSNRFSHQLPSSTYHSVDQCGQSTDVDGTTSFTDSRYRYNSSDVAVSSADFDLYNTFGGQETTTAALFQESAVTSSRLLELHGRYNSRVATLHPLVPSHPTILVTTPASSQRPVALTQADYAGNKITNDDLSHDCGSLYVGSDDESDEATEWGFPT
jgi:HSF-type DNA-binding